MNEKEAEQLVLPLIPDCRITEVDDHDELFAVHFTNLAPGVYAGGGPVLVVKDTGTVYQTGSGRPTEEFIAAFRATGDPYAQRENLIEITSVSETVERAATILAVKKIVECDLEYAKEFLEDVVDRQPRRLEFRHEHETVAALSALESVGFIGRQLWSTEL